MLDWLVNQIRRLRVFVRRKRSPPHSTDSLLVSPISRRPKKSPHHLQHPQQTYLSGSLVSPGRLWPPQHRQNLSGFQTSANKPVANRCGPLQRPASTAEASASGAGLWPADRQIIYDRQLSAPVDCIPLLQNFNLFIFYITLGTY
ncbi:unnamed protein product [Protopolystoma xenopodis]|uniref:Uncharacterized protein n=1 Tax=Protopolystoma xenopodis TaxID=117903 RepID=A0A3S5CGN5_9PLAT|nr:unnamed protein product [Protopolystoma xenopodis]